MKYEPHADFSAQAIAFRALVQMYDRVENEDLEQYEYLPVLVFAAFSIEAYINSVGARKIAFWDQIERLSWKNKIEILHTNVGASADWGGEPLQVAMQVFGVRDRLAHGKSERVTGPMCDTYMEAKSMFMVQSLKPDWFSRIDKEWVLATRERVYALLAYLGELYRLPNDDFTHHSRLVVTEHA